MSGRFIKIRGARVHNLKNISLDIPRNKLVVITGLSGSGKSSLAFDTVYAEGQRRYVESLSAYARQFLEQMEKPDVDTIEGLSPAIAIEQRSSRHNPRSTVATATEIYDYLRLLFARAGRAHCPGCGKEIRPQSVQQIVDQILALVEGARIRILAPLVKGRKGRHENLLRRLRRDGFTRVLVDGEIRLLEEEISLDRNRTHDISVVVDRLVVKQGIRQRLTDSMELTLGLSGGRAVVHVLPDREIFFSRNASCEACGISIPEPTPQMFSFNNPQGACPECGGLGSKRHLDPELVIADPSLPVTGGAVAPWSGRLSGYYAQLLASVCRHYGVDSEAAFQDLPPVVQDVILHGSGEEEIQFSYRGRKSRYEVRRPFEGVIPSLERRFRETESQKVREEIARYMAVRPCPACGGARLGPVGLSVKVGGRSISEITALSVEGATAFFEELELEEREQAIAQRILREIRGRLGFLQSVGVGYLTLDRAVSTLSGGEDQRIRLATQIGSGLAGVLYVLDEPSIGLHQRDNRRLLRNLKRLRDLGNTILVVEHDAETILAADHVVDMGPGAGRKGGEVVFQGPPRLLVQDERSVTGAYLSGRKIIPVPSRRRKGSGRTVVVERAAENNLKDITVTFPLGIMICVTGVSGSGKSSLVNGILYPALSRALYRSRRPVGRVGEVRGVEAIDKIVHIDQSPIGRTPRSNPATYTGLFKDIRELFAMLPEAKARGYKPGRFSFNVKGGRCESCKGEGILRIEMHFLPDIYVQCETCRGLRYNRDTLDVRYRGQNIAQILDMTVNQAYAFFQNIPALKTKLETLMDVGLGYIKLGQAATTLSGGEAQRVKLSRELARRGTGNTLYLLDEPTTGLHFEDIHKLLQVLNRLVGMGNTVVVIEHNLDVIKTADHIIDLGPEGGERGGFLVASGTPEDVARVPGSYTGRYLKAVLGI